MAVGRIVNQDDIILNPIEGQKYYVKSWKLCYLADEIDSKSQTDQANGLCWRARRNCGKLVRVISSSTIEMLLLKPVCAVRVYCSWQRIRCQEDTVISDTAQLCRK